MRKNVSRILGAVLAGVMILGTMTACGPKEPANDSSAVVESSAVGSEAEETAEITYPLDTDAKFTIAIVNDKPIAAVSKDITPTPFAKAWAEQTGVELEFIVCEDNNAMNLLFADGNLPDIIFWRAYSYAGGPEKAIDDGVMVPISVEDMEKYAPDFIKVMEESHPDVRRTHMTDDGDYFGFGMVMDERELQNASGMLVRKDWCDEFGMEVPTDVESFEAYLQACIDIKGVKNPLPSAELLGPMWYGYWTGAFNLPKAEEYQVDGTVHLGYAEPEYKDVLAWCKSLADRGLMDTSFTAYENGVYGGTMGCWFNSIGSGIGTYMAAMETEDPTFEVAAMPSFPNADGVILGGLSEKPVGVAYCWITPACEDVETALKFLNYGYTEAGNLLWNFGVEGESYTMVDGVPTYTDLITHNPDGWTMQQAMAQYNRAAVGGGPFVQSTVYAEQYFWRPQQLDATVVWANHDADQFRMPRYQVAAEDAAEFSRIQTDIKTYVEESRTKFITGELSLDDYDTVYIKTLKEMGLDRMLEIIQAACDKFYAR